MGLITKSLPSHSSTLSYFPDDSEIKSMITTLDTLVLTDVRTHIDESLRKDVINELSALCTQCDKFIQMQQKRLSRNLTIVTKISLFVFFIAGGMQRLNTNMTENHDLMAVLLSMSIHFVIFIWFLLIVRYFEQIVQPFNVNYDVFDLKQILDDKFAEMETLKVLFIVDDPVRVEIGE